MSIENSPSEESKKTESPAPEQVATETKAAVADDAEAAPDQDFDEYVKTMAALREGGRPILCW